MKRISEQMFGWVLAGAFALCQPARAAQDEKSPGTGPTYDLIGKVAVLHEGRIKPLDTVAREKKSSRSTAASRSSCMIPQTRSTESSTPRPPHESRKGGSGKVQMLGAGRCVPRVEHCSGILGRTAVHPGGLSAAAAHAHGRCNSGAPQGDRRKVDQLRSGKSSVTKARVGARAGFRHARYLHPRLKVADRRPQIDRRACRQAHRRTQMDGAARAGGEPQSSRRRNARLPRVGPPELQTPQRQFDA